MRAILKKLLATLEFLIFFTVSPVETFFTKVVVVKISAFQSDEVALIRPSQRQDLAGN